MPAGVRGTGGPAIANRAYLVGDRGPELLTVGQSSYVHPNSSIGSGGGGDTNHFHINGSDPATIAREIERVMKNRVARSRSLALDGRGVN